MKIQKFFDSSFFQEFYKKALYNEIEASIKNNELSRLQELCSEESGIDLTYDEGYLGVIAVNNLKILRYLTDQCPRLIEKYGQHILSAAAWARSSEAISFLINEQHVDYHDLEGTNIYEYCIQASGNTETA
jgi:hypothetical protein